MPLPTDVMPDATPVGAKIYLAYHRESQRISSPILQPIQAGRAYTQTVLDGMPGDDTGAHISERNAEYCELTAHYWAWKNDKSAWPIGLMHYRRVFDFANLHGDRYPEKYLLKFNARTYATAATRYFSEGPEADILVPRPLRLRQSVRRQYNLCHEAADLVLLREVITERRPDFLADFDSAMARKRLVLGNIFVMRRAVFDHYSELLFDTLGAVYAAQQGVHRTAYQRRYIGFLAERMLTAYVYGGLVQAETDGAKIVHRTVLNIDPHNLKNAPLSRLMRFVARGQLEMRDMAQLASLGQR